jgi:hypothetical protein
MKIKNDGAWNDENFGGETVSAIASVSVTLTSVAISTGTFFSSTSTLTSTCC